MSIAEQFNDDQWFVLGSTPTLIGAAMSSADLSGLIGTVKEICAGMRASVTAIKDYPDSELVQQLLKKADNWDDAKAKISDYKTRSQAQLKSVDIKTPSDLQAHVIGNIEQCLKLVDEKCSNEDAQIYRQWCLKVASSVANASKEGSILGFGGTRISEDEQTLLNKIEHALGVKTTTLLA